MRILIVGSEPYCIAGVPNYVRPLALEFVGLGHEVFFFFSGAWYKKYNWYFTPYLRINKKHFPFEYAEVINSPSWSHNYGSPLFDVTCPQIEALFLKYIKKVEPDVMHVHNMAGLPASIIEIAERSKIKIFHTVHDYHFLCQKNVMIYDGGLCAGPMNLEKCSRCNDPLDLKKLRFIARLENTNKSLLEFLVIIKRKISRKMNAYKDLHPINQIDKKDQLMKLEKEIKIRLYYMVNLMNNTVHLNICVSSDVKETLSRFGVHKEKMLVQHIGSFMGKDQSEELHPLHYPLVIGNIGGIGHYKGTHVLLEAISRLKNENFVLKLFGKYEKDYVKNIMKGRKHLPIEFLGRYKPEDLPSILQEIDLMVLPSICNDTAPQTIFESHSARIPIIASHIGGFPDFIQDGVNGYLFRPGDSQDLANKLNNVLNFPHVIYELSEKIPRLKTIEENALELIALYEDALWREN